MRILLTYGVLTGGGCERRMGDLVRWLLDNGDEAWIAANVIWNLGRDVLFGQCGVPEDRVLLWGPEGNDPQTWPALGGDWIRQQVSATGADVVDVQWHPGYSLDTYSCPAVATIHGAVGAPPPSVFEGVISVQDEIIDGGAYRQGAPVIHNWVNLSRFPFTEQLGEGICHIGRGFKAENAVKILEHYDGVVDAYGSLMDPLLDPPKGWRWQGWCDPAEVMPRYRVVLGTAQVAMEAMAAGRHVICGQTPHVNTPDMYSEGRLVAPANVEALARVQFAYRFGHELKSLAVWQAAQYALANERLEDRRALRAWIEEHHSLDGQCRRIRDYYEEVVSNATVTQGAETRAPAGGVL